MWSQVSIEELGKAKLGPKPPVVIDVRDPDEYAASHLPEAISIPLNRLAKEATWRYTNRSQPIVVYCDVGIRSHHAARLLRSMGYRSVKEIDGGMQDMQDTFNA